MVETSIHRVKEIRTRTKNFDVMVTREIVIRYEDYQGQTQEFILTLYAKELNELQIS